jgi:hypothetical protein
VYSGYYCSHIVLCECDLRSRRLHSSRESLCLGLLVVPDVALVLLALGVGLLVSAFRASSCLLFWLPVLCSYAPSPLAREGALATEPVMTLA